MPRDEQALRGLLTRLAAGLASAHRLGAIHRDMSPDNVMLPGGDLSQAKIIDFGIAKNLGGGLPTLIGDGFAGKLGWVAPEQLGDHGGEIGPWTDVYSLALVILSVARGAKADLGGSFADALRKRREGIDLSAAPKGLRPLLADMLASDPADRPRDMEEVLARLSLPPPGPIGEEMAEALPPHPLTMAMEAPAEPAWEVNADEPPSASRLGLMLALGVTLTLALVLLLVFGRQTPRVVQNDAGPAATEDAAWLFRRWCAVDQRSRRQVEWTIRRIGDRQIRVTALGRSQNENIIAMTSDIVSTDRAVYRHDRTANVVTVREGIEEITELEQCR